jgi:hypothetical protein
MVWTDRVLENAPPPVLPLSDVDRLCETLPLPSIEPGFVLLSVKLSVFDSFSLNAKASALVVLLVPEAFIPAESEPLSFSITVLVESELDVETLPLIEWAFATEKLSDDDATPSMYVIVPESVML